jgi:potassium-transporting ATPase KdpC subunit
MNEIIRAIKISLILMVLVSGVYPLFVTLAGNLLFHDKATGSFVNNEGKRLGSRLIGQRFTRPEYFHGRPSAAGEQGYDPMKATSFNSGPLAPGLVSRVQQNIEKVLKENTSLSRGKIPVELVASSGSGLDPHLSPEAILVQVERVALARSMTSDQVIELVSKNTEDPQLGFLGKSRVNIFLLNLALDQIQVIKERRQVSEQLKSLERHG